MTKTMVYHENKSSYAKLIIRSKHKIECVDNIGNVCVLGRKTTDAVTDVQIDSSLVSKIHGQFFLRNEEFYYQDLGSSNGTYINGYHFSKHKGNHETAIKLNNGDILKIDYRDREKQHTDAVVIIFTTALEYENEWDRLVLSDSVTEIPIGREYSSINVSSDLISKKHGRFMLNCFFRRAKYATRR